MNTLTANRLIHETSPYLLQHAYNPVDWYPWCDEAFARAKTEDKPVFLSVGYSTCHWCHVMEQESFEDETVAEALRRDFIAVKVDKEERPDIDAVYMEITHALTGSGGWPMTVLLTPDQKPFFAGTYFPKNPRRSMPGLLDILREASAKWREDRASLESVGDKLIRRVNAASVPAEREPGEPEWAIDLAFESFNRIFDESNGGFGRAPKFPSPHNLMFLMRYGVLAKNPRAVRMAEKTLEQMYRGGLYDHVGGGFSRYSTDARWLVPHFEKMLYDNALLTLAYLDAHQLTGHSLYRRVAEESIRYVLREMTGPDGEFYCAQDADSEGHEGLFYVWRPEEITAILGTQDGGYWNEWYGITKQGNFDGQSIPTLLGNLDYADENARIEQLNEKVRAHRLTRVKLHKDDKALTSWNAMTIAALARAYAVLGHTEYRDAAERAVAFIREKLTDSTGHLHVSYRDDEAKGHGFLDDYAYWAWALLSLYEATFEQRHLDSAAEYADRMCRLFEGKGCDSGGFYMYSDDAETLITRPKEVFDGATPSGNSVAAYVLQKLAAITGDEKWDDRAGRQFEFMARASHGNPAAHSFWNIAAMTEIYPARRLVCAAASLDDAERFRKVLAKRFLPGLTAIVTMPGYEPVRDETAFYMCEGKSCAAPFTGFDRLEEILDA